MLPITNLTVNRNFQIRNFEEDKNATLNKNRGLRYNGIYNSMHIFSGEYYLLNDQETLIESFEINIFIDKSYPNTFPIVKLIYDKIDKNDEYHINDDLTICFDYDCITNYYARYGVRIYDFIEHYLFKYFCWILTKKYGDPNTLQEWAHREDGTIQFYKILLDTSDKNVIQEFLRNYIQVKKIQRNDKCLCGSGKKMKNCHLKEAIFLKSTPIDKIMEHMKIFT